MHVIVVTVGISILDKSFKRSRYELLMGSEDGRSKGLLDCPVQDVERGRGWNTQRRINGQLEVEREVFEQSQDLCHIGDGIRRGKRNPFSAEVSSLYGLFKGEHLDPDDCRIVLLATDSSDGVFAARLNKRVIAHRLLGYGEEAVLAW